jgi:hypothetical protein
MPVVASKQDLIALRPMWEDVRRDLLRVKRLIDEEIRSYPTPIPRCDAQFNHLHEQRARLARELDRVSAISEERPGHPDYLRLIEEFIASAPYLDEAEERQFRARIKAKVSAITGEESPRIARQRGSDK